MKHRAVMVSGLDVLLAASKRLQQKKILSLKDRLLSLFQSHVRLLFALVYCFLCVCILLVMLGSQSQVFLIDYLGR